MTELRHSRDVTRFHRKRYIMKRMRRFRDKLGEIPGMNYFNKHRNIDNWPTDYVKKEDKWPDKPRVKKVREWDDE